jgi:hypothetical protein
MHHWNIGMVGSSEKFLRNIVKRKRRFTSSFKEKKNIYSDIYAFLSEKSICIA